MARALTQDEYDDIHERYLRARMKKLPAAEFVDFMMKDLPALRDERKRYRQIINLLVTAIQFEAEDAHEVADEANRVLRGEA